MKVRTDRPRSVAVAAALLSASVVPTLFVVFVQRLPSGIARVDTLYILIPVSMIILVLSVFCYMGWRWARQGIIIVLGAAYFQYVAAPWEIPKLFLQNPINGTLDAIVFSARIIAFFLLITPAANKWFTTRRG